MNKTELKRFAISARRDLIEKVALRAKKIGIDDKKVDLVIKEEYGKLIVNGTEQDLSLKSAIQLLAHDLRIKGYKQLIEEVAYTWFNRIIAMRYMEVHGQLSVRVLSSSTGKVEPDIVSQFETMDLNVDIPKIKELLRKGDIEQAYRILFIAQCNALNPVLPFMFEKIDDYTELLLPDFLLDSESVINKLIRNVSTQNFYTEDERGNVEILGWLYQYYMIERKEQVGGLKNTTVKKEDLPIVTQLFTPKWIVQYMLENSLGKIYDEKYPNNNLSVNWNYYLRSSEKGTLLPYFTSLEELKIIDPACGSGHILVYAFDLLYDMYEEFGYPSREIPTLILEKNLYGLDIDKRSQQIANFALVMKAVERQPRLLKRVTVPRANVYEVTDTDDSLSVEAIDFFVSNELDREKLLSLLDVFKNAKQYGSLISPVEADYRGWIERLSNLDNTKADLIEEMYIIELKDKLLPLLQQALLLNQKYDVVVTNPPYHNKFNSDLREFIHREYKDFKSDLFSTFIYKTMEMVKKDGYTALMTPFTWLFNSSNEKLRKSIVESKSISSLVLLEYSAFKDATVPICTFVIHNQSFNQTGEYIRLSELKGDQAHYVRVAAKDNAPYRFSFNCGNILKVKGIPISFWASQKMLSLLEGQQVVGDAADLKAGLSTGNNNIFQRNWYEVNFTKIGFGYDSIEETLRLQHKWFPCNSGGEFRKWYGNNYVVIDWLNNGEAIRNYRNSQGKLRSAVRNDEYYFKEGITWTKLSSSNFGSRYKEKGFIFDDTGRSAFCNDTTDLFILLALFCSKISKEIMSMLNPTLSFTNNDIARIPFIEINGESKGEIQKLSMSCVEISKREWDSNEKSWGFLKHPFINQSAAGISLIEDAFSAWESERDLQFEILKSNEEKINKIFIDSYHIETELSPYISDEEVTISKASRSTDAKSFLSYFIGCMMGRYSLDVEGLIYAGGEWDDLKYKTFIPNKYGLIHLTDEHYFENDILTRLREFLAVTFSAATIEENLQWLAESLELKRNETAEERLRRYFLDEFFKNHCQMYQKRPIYWLVDSGKQKGLRTLIYMHRYQPDTMATIRFEHLQEIQAKYNNEIAAVDLRIVNPNLSATEKRDLEKRKAIYQKRLEELLEFDKKLAEYANAQISIDLDDGVNVNYPKFDKVLAKIK